MVYVSIIFVGTIIAGSISPCGAVGLPAPSPIHRVQPNNLDRIGAQKNHNLRYAQIFDNYLYQNDSIEELYDITSKFLNTDISLEELELILELRGGGRLEDISWIIFYIWLWKLQNNHVQGFQMIKPPHHTLTGSASST